MQNVFEAEKALTEKPMLSTSVERVVILNEIKSKYNTIPQPLRFSRTLSELLSRVSTPIEKWDMIVGRTVDRELDSDEETLFQNFLKHPDYSYKQTILQSGHCSFSWDELVKYGISGLCDKVSARLEKETDTDKQIFLKAVLEVYDAVKQYILRYAKKAHELGLLETEQNLLKAADIPDTFASALQLLWIVALINCSYISPNSTLTLGRLDNILFPLYQKDIDSGILTEQKAKDYITDYYCKHNLIMGRGEHQVGDDTNSTGFNRILAFDAPQYLLLAGTDRNGASAVNRLTELFSECINPKFKNPVVVVRYFKNMNSEHPLLWKTLIGKALQSASLMFYNDDNVLATYKNIGIPEKDRREYEHFGCNWPSLGPDSSWMQIGPKSAKFNAYISDEEKKILTSPYMRMNAKFGWAEDFVIVLRQLVQKDNVTIDDFYDAFLERMGNFIDRKLSRAALELEVKRRKPSSILTFGDCFKKRPLETAECISANAKYHFEFQSFYMFGTVVDCFITVDKLVFVDKKLTLEKLLKATEDNFEHYPKILKMCRQVPKYGSDDDFANAHVKRLSNAFCRLVIEKDKPYLEKYRLFLTPCMQSDTWHLKYGKSYGATPDGRLAGKPFSQNSRPSNGACINGIPGMLNSMLSLPSDGLLSGALNLDVDPKPFKTDEGIEAFGTLVGAYFNNGGLHAQISSTDLETLLKAQKDPDLYRDVRVRVTGYSAVFVDMPENLQNDVIERFK